MRFRSAKHLRWYAGTALFFVALHFIGVLGPVERLVRRVVDPVVHIAFAGMQSIKTSTLFSQAKHSDEEFTGVERDRDLLKTRIALVESENATLRRQLNYPDRRIWKTIGAEVLGKTADVTEQVLIIDRGTKDHIKVGQIVFTDQGILVGEVSHAEIDRAYVRLLDDRESRVGALHANSSKPIGIVEGGYGLGVRLSLVPPEEVVTIGDLVVTNDSSEQMPRGLLIGKIASVGREAYEPFQHALIEPTISYDEVKTVTIILSK